MKKLLTSICILALLFACSNKENSVETSVTDSTKTEKAINSTEYQTNNVKNMEEVCNFLKECGYYFLATVEGNQPRVRPFGTINIFEGKLYIQSGKVKKVAHQIAENPKAEICAFNASKGNWIRIETTLVPDERVEAKTSMLDAYPSLKDMYSATDSNTIVYFMTNTKATISSFTEPEKNINF